MTIVSMHAERATARKVVWSGAQPKDPIQTSRRDGGAAMATGEDDKARFARIVLPHLADAYSLARWITGNRTDADDVVQDACLRAFRAIWSTADGNPRAWVLTIVRNTAYASMSLNRGVELVPLTSGSDESEDIVARLPSSDDDPETSLIRSRERDRVRQMIAALPIELRETLVLRELEELSYKEIAEVTRMPIGTVMSRLWRARRLLAQAARRDEAA